MDDRTVGPRGLCPLTAAISARGVGGVRQRGLSASALRQLLQGFAIRRAAERRAMPPLERPLRMARPLQEHRNDHEYSQPERALRDHTQRP
jgi:hypothetical protein